MTLKFLKKFWEVTKTKINNLHYIDVDAEIISALAQEITTEINKELISILRQTMDNDV